MIRAERLEFDPSIPVLPHGVAHGGHVCPSHRLQGTLAGEGVDGSADHRGQLLAVLATCRIHDDVLAIDVGSDELPLAGCVAEHLGGEHTSDTEGRGVHLGRWTPRCNGRITIWVTRVDGDLVVHPVTTGVVATVHVPHHVSPHRYAEADEWVVSEWHASLYGQVRGAETSTDTIVIEVLSVHPAVLWSLFYFRVE